MEITPYINKKHTEPLYAQLYYFFRSEIEKGKIPAGKRLPSIRLLSQQLHISKNSVETAYHQLLAEGYVESVPKSGMFVMPIDKVLQLPSTKKVKSDPGSLEKNPPTQIDFQYGDIELGKFPYKKWRKCINEALDQEIQGIYGYGEKDGNYNFKQAIADYLYHARGVSTTASNIVLTAGTQSSITILCQLFNVHNQRIAIEDPGYDGVRTVFQNFNAELVPISLEQDGMDMDVLWQSRAKLCYVTPSHQFPMGMILPIQKRQKLLQWAQEENAFIIEDDYDGEFRYQGQPVPSLKSLDSNGRVIYLGTFSKAFLPAARVSYLVLPDHLLQKFEEKFHTFSQSVSPMIQEALYLFMKQGHFDQHIRKMRKIYHEKHKALVETITYYFGENIEIVGHNAGLHLLLQFKEVDVIELVKRAGEKGVKVYLTEKYYIKNDFPWEEQLLLLGFGGMTFEQIRLGIKILAEVYEELV